MAMFKSYVSLPEGRWCSDKTVEWDARAMAFLIAMVDYPRAEG